MISRKIIIIFSAFLLVSCSTQKNTWWSRNYNSTTAKYNTLFNGEQSFKNGEKQLISNHQDNFSHILHIFPYSGPEKAGMVKGDMDRAIQKGHRAIRKRSITARPQRKPSRNNERANEFYNRREFNRYMDDAYLLIGKAHLYNHEFNDAINVFEHTLREFPNQPARFDALIWMARTRIEMGDFENALLLLNRYDAIGQSPNRLYGEYMATYADYLIRSGQYQSAIPFMISAAAEAPGKWHRSRRHYILAQLYHRTGQYALAHESYRRVMRSSPGYEMELNARINNALIDGMINGNFATARRDLYRLASQVKNQDQRDRIYFGLAQSYLEEKDTLMAVTNLRLSAGYNMGNQSLRTETYLQLAELYFQLPNYIPSYAYYDSTMTLLPEYDRRFAEVKKQHAGLKALTAHFRTIAREDSLQMLARMPESDLDNFIAAIIEQERQVQLNQSVGARSNLASASHDPLFYRNFSSQLNRPTDEQGQWYFYNPTTVSLGKMEFERRWGRRANEDNWRRANKGTTAPEPTSQQPGFPSELEFDRRGGATSLPGTQDSGTRASTSLPSKEELIADIPKTAEQLALSDDRLAFALFGAGMVFLDHFKDADKAAEMFYKMATEHPTHPLAEQAWFWGYRSYETSGNLAGMQRMKSGLLQNFANGRYAPFVTDPEYAKNIRNKEKELNDLYEQAFASYQSNRFTEALLFTTRIKQEAENEELLRKSLLLSAVSHGKGGSPTAFRQDLTVLADDFPNSREGMLAKTWLSMFDEGRRPVPGSILAPSSTPDQPTYRTETSESIQLYTMAPESPHFIFMIVESQADINRLMFNLADYNFSRFLMADYDIDTQLLPDGQRLITIGAFTNQREGMDYYYALRSNPQVLAAPNMQTLQLMAASKANLDILRPSGDILAYRTFFSSNYLLGGGGITIDLSQNKVQPSAESTQPVFTTSDGATWGMVVLPPRTDGNRVSGFLSGQAFNQFRLRVTTRTVRLSGGETVLLIESFENIQQAISFFETIRNTNFWNNQIRASAWKQVAVSPENFKLIESQGNTETYSVFYDNQMQ